MVCLLGNMGVHVCGDQFVEGDAKMIEGFMEREY